MLTKTYTYKGTEVAIAVTVRSGFLDQGNGRFVPVNKITYTVGSEPEAVIDNVLDVNMDKTLRGVEETANKFIDGIPDLEAQLLAMGYN